MAPISHSVTTAARSATPAPAATTPFAERRHVRRLVVGGVQRLRHEGPHARREDAAHTGHERQELPPLLGASLHARRPAPLLVAEAALALELLARVVVGEAVERELQPAVRGELPGELARIGDGVEREPHRGGAARAQRQDLDALGAAEGARVHVVRARLEARDDEVTARVGVHRRLARRLDVLRGHDDAVEAGAGRVVDVAGDRSERRRRRRGGECEDEERDTRHGSPHERIGHTAQRARTSPGRRGAVHPASRSRRYAVQSGRPMTLQ